MKTPPLFEGHDRVIDTSSAHHIEWTFGDDSVEAKAVCTSGADANCRLYGDCDCEGWHIERDQDGTPFHMAIEYDEETDAESPVRHSMRSSDDCNVEEWLNAETPMECASFPGSLLIARTPITPTWEGDYYVWAPAAVDAANEARP